MKSKINYYENQIQNKLKYILLFIFITTIFNAFIGFTDHDSWKIGDWLINYQGGFIRRGLFGEAVIQLSNITSINPGLFVFIFQVYLYAIFIYYSYQSLKLQPFLLPYLFILFSPFLFTFQINDMLGGFRKEILYFSILSFMVWFANEKNIHQFRILFYFTLIIIYPMLILTHEMLIVYLPYIIAIYVLIDKVKIIHILLALIPSIVSLYLSVVYHGTEIQIIEILNSLVQQNYSISGGAISWLDKDTSYGITYVSKWIKEKNYIYYIIVTLTALISYIPLYDKLRIISKNKLALYLILSSLIGSIPIFIVAIDWGRFIYIHLVSIFFMTLLIKIQNKQEPINLNYLTKTPIIIFLIIYNLSWHIPHYSSPLAAYDITLTSNNIINYVKPYAKVVIYFYKNI